MKKIILLGHTSKICNDIEGKTKDFKFLKYDIRNPNFELKEYSEIILNFASANPTSQNKFELVSQNEKIANDVVSLASKVNAKTLINISAMSIFNGVEYGVVNGHSEPAPKDEYSISKLRMENIFKKSGIDTVINLRIPGVENINNSHTLFGRFRHAILNGRDVLYFNGDKLTNNVIDCKNLHGFILAILSSNISKSINFNLGSKNPIKIIEVLQLMKLRYKSSSRLIEYKSPNNSFHIDLSEELKYFNLSNTYEYI